MGKQTVYQIHLNPDLIEQFNETLSENEHVSEQLSFTEDYFHKKKYCGVNAWDCICSCIHRIRDTVAYLNDQKLGQKSKYRSAFDFINFMNNAAVVLDSIDMLASILGVDLTEENARIAAFNQLGKDGSGTDKNTSNTFARYALSTLLKPAAIPATKAQTLLPVHICHGFEEPSWKSLGTATCMQMSSLMRQILGVMTYAFTWIRFLRISNTDTAFLIK